MKKVVILILGVALSIMALGIDKGYYVSPSIFKSLVESEDTFIIDARGDEKAFNDGHIEGATLINWLDYTKDVSSPKKPGWGTLKGRTALEKQLQEIGLEKGRKVIVYGNLTNGWAEEARVLWMLKYIGVKDIKVLNGGIKAWEGRGYPLTTTETKNPKGDIAINKTDDNILVISREIEKNINRYIIIDVRDESEYKGDKGYGEKRKGHIENAININYKSFANENGYIKGPKEVEELLKEKNAFDKNKTYVVYCTAGVRSSFVWSVLDNYGYKVLNYDEGIAGWTVDKNRKVIKE